MKKLLFVLLLSIVVLGCFTFLLYYCRWKPLWSLEPECDFYAIGHNVDDTLRIIMIGDSWTGMRTETINKEFSMSLFQQTNRPVVVKTKGKGGEKCRGIYHQMFENGDAGTKDLLVSGPDFCVIFAGINDAAANLGVRQFQYYYRLILEFLLRNNIRPVVVEIPDVNIWRVKKIKPWKDLASDYVKSLMTNCGIYRFSDYRKALNTMLIEEKLLDRVIFVPMTEWNDDTGLFLDDSIHLNQKGYAKMDSCIASHIGCYLNNF